MNKKKMKLICYCTLNKVAPPKTVLLFQPLSSFDGTVPEHVVEYIMDNVTGKDIHFIKENLIYAMNAVCLVSCYEYNHSYISGIQGAQTMGIKIFSYFI
jgi:hypothetical protein